MTPTEFRSSIVIVDNEKALLALFDGGNPPSTVAVLRCSQETAIALKKNLGSALLAKRS